MISHNLANRCSLSSTLRNFLRKSFHDSFVSYVLAKLVISLHSLKYVWLVSFVAIPMFSSIVATTSHNIYVALTSHFSKISRHVFVARHIDLQFPQLGIINRGKYIDIWPISSQL
jgi:hypothetical protein